MKGRVRVTGALFMIAALIVMMLPASEADAAESSASDFKMEGSTLVKYKGTATSVSIPDTVEIIGEDAFEDNAVVEQVSIPNSVKQIEPYAFWGCEKLSKIVLGDGLEEIGDYAFAGCRGLQSMVVPSNVKSIGIMAFADCVNMETVNIPPSTLHIHDTAFNGCSKLVINCEKGSKAESYAEAFYERQKEMPEYEDTGGAGPSDSGQGGGTVTEPPVEIPDTPGVVWGSTKVVGNQAVVFMDNTWGHVYGGEGSVNIANNQNAALSAPEGIPKYTIVDGKIVADQAYYRAADLQNYTLPSGIQEVGQFCFARSGIERITFSEGVETISYGAFYHCDRLEEVALPSSVINVEPMAFAHTAWVEDFLAGGEASQGSDFLVSNTTLVAYRGDASEVVLPKGVKVVAGEAFYGHDEIETVTFPDSLQVVGEGAFEDCSGLREVVFQEGVTDIKDRAFYGTGIGEVRLPASLERMGLLAFPREAEVSYGGEEPVKTHETSAERLSNGSYRGLDGRGEPGVQVVGLPGNAFVKLEGADRSYTLEVKQTEDTGAVAQAFQRLWGQTLPEDLVLYDLLLYDESGIPLTKLGRRPLTVTLPVPEQFGGEGLEMITLDRNGQLENVEYIRLRVDGEDCVRFTTDHLSLFGLTGTGEDFDASGVIEETTVINSMSAAPGARGTKGWEAGMPPSLKWSLGACFFLMGGVLLIKSFRH